MLYRTAVKRTYGFRSKITFVPTQNWGVFYFEMQYPRFRINSSMKKMMSVWDKQYPVNEWECKRAKRIEYFQKNPNIIVKTKCIEAGIWPQEVY